MSSRKFLTLPMRMVFKLHMDSGLLIPLIVPGIKIEGHLRHLLTIGQTIKASYFFRKMMMKNPSTEQIN